MLCMFSNDFQTVTDARREQACIVKKILIRLIVLKALCYDKKEINLQVVLNFWT